MEKDIALFFNLEERVLTNLRHLDTTREERALTNLDSLLLLIMRELLLRCNLTPHTFGSIPKIPDSIFPPFCSYNSIASPFVSFQLICC